MWWWCTSLERPFLAVLAHGHDIEGGYIQLLVKTCKKTKVSCRLGLPDEVMLRQMQKMTERYRNRLLKLKDAKETYRVRHYMNLYDMFRASSAWSIMEVQELLQYVGTVGVAVLC